MENIAQRPATSFFALRTGLAKHFKEEFRPILFSAALAVVLAKLGLLSLFTKLSLLVVANLAAPDLPGVAPDTAAPVVVYLDEQRWVDRYHEQSPLDRCAMADDLARMLERSPRTVAVDFDLSPTLSAAQPECQARLDQLLDRHASALVLLSPLRVSSGELFDVKRRWALARCAKGLAFGDGSLDESLGIVIDVRPSPYSLASQVHQRGEPAICKELGTDAGADKWLRKHGIEEEGDARPAQADADAVPVNFSGFAREAAVMSLDDPRLGHISNWNRRDVFFGGDYGASRVDAFLTPIGKIPGVAVHAALRHSLADPVKEPPHPVGFVLDIVIAFLFSLAISVFWTHYVQARRRQDFRQQESTLIVLAFVGVYCALVLALFWVAAGLFARGILIAPLLMALSMLSDGFVTGPITALGKAPEEGHTQSACAPIVEGSFYALLAVLALGVASALLLHHVGVPLLLALAGAAFLLDRRIGTRYFAPEGVALAAHAGHGAGAAAGVARLGGPSWTVPLGVSTLPKGRQWLGFAVFAGRQFVFWAVVIDAMFLIFNH